MERKGKLLRTRRDLYKIRKQQRNLSVQDLESDTTDGGGAKPCEVVLKHESVDSAIPDRFGTNFYKKAELSLDPNLDEVDYCPKDYGYDWMDIIGTVLAIIGYFFDLGSDLFLAYQYYQRGQPWWFGLTLGFVFLPSIVIGIFSLRWYILDYKHDVKNRVSWKVWVVRIIVLILQLGPALR